MHPTPTVSLYLAGGCLLAGLSMQAMAAPGEDTIYLNRPVQYLSLPSGGTAKSTDIQNKTDIPDWLKAKVSRYEAKAYSATANDGSMFTDATVITSTAGEGVQKSCLQEVGNSTSSSSTPFSRLGSNQQIVVLRGDLVNVCR